MSGRAAPKFAAIDAALAQGLDDREIVETLGVSPFYVSRIRRGAYTRPAMLPLASADDLAAALAQAPELTARYRLDLPLARSQECAPANSRPPCPHVDLCRARFRAGLWAVCERPDAGDLLALGYTRALAAAKDDNGKRSDGAGRGLAPRTQEDDMDYGIGARREALGWSRQDLCQRAGITEKGLINVETGGLPFQSTLIALAWALEMEPLRLLGLDEDALRAARAGDDAALARALDALPDAVAGVAHQGFTVLAPTPRVRETHEARWEKWARGE